MSILGFTTSAQGPGVELQRVVAKVNMNALGDDHVSFSARQLAVSPDQRFLLVSTDSPRILLFRREGQRGYAMPCRPHCFSNCIAAGHQSAVAQLSPGKRPWTELVPNCQHQLPAEIVLRVPHQQSNNSSGSSSAYKNMLLVASSAV